MKLLTILISAVLMEFALSPNISPGDYKNSYARVLHQLGAKRAVLRKQSVVKPNEAYSSSSKLLVHMLCDSIFPAWYGTPWDFNGISNVPGEGNIACGYFVSTTLKHAGFNLNRYKLAQQASSVIVAAICGKSKTTRYNSVASILGHLKKQPDGLYVVGLDYHVGFLAVKSGAVDFVHSDYFSNQVKRERAKDAAAFSGSQLFVLGEISDNDALMKNWLQGGRVYP